MAWCVLTYRTSEQSPVSGGWHLFIPSQPDRVNSDIAADNVPSAMSWAAAVIREHVGGQVVEWIDNPRHPGTMWGARVEGAPPARSD